MPGLSSILRREKDARPTNFAGWLKRELRNLVITNHGPPLPGSRLSGQGLRWRATSASEYDDTAEKPPLR